MEPIYTLSLDFAALLVTLVCTFYIFKLYQTFKGGMLASSYGIITIGLAVLAFAVALHLMADYDLFSGTILASVPFRSIGIVITLTCLAIGLSGIRKIWNPKR